MRGCGWGPQPGSSKGRTLCIREPCTLGIPWRRGKEVERGSKHSAAEGPGRAQDAGRRGCSLQGQMCPLAVMADDQSQGHPSRPDISKPCPKAVGARLIQGSRARRNCPTGWPTCTRASASLQSGRKHVPVPVLGSGARCPRGAPARPLAEDTRVAGLKVCRESRGWGLLAGADTRSGWSLGLGPLFVPARSLSELVPGVW